MRVRLILLPGTDGTGALATDFAAACGDAMPLTVSSYPPDLALGYDALAARLRPALPVDAPFVLIGESFGGPLALMLAATKPPGLAGIVMCASFARHPLASLPVPATVLRRLPTHALPMPVLMRWLMGRWTTPSWQARARRALATVSADALRARIAAVMSIDVTALLADLTVPLLYLRATQDRVVPRTCGDRVVAAAPHASIVDIEAPHFLMQAAPAACADAVRRFLADAGCADEGSPSDALSP